MYLYFRISGTLGPGFSGAARFSLSRIAHVKAKGTLDSVEQKNYAAGEQEQVALNKITLELFVRVFCFVFVFRSPFEYVRWAFYQNVTSFATLEDSFTAMMDIFMLSGWPIFLDAAGDVGNTTLANIFFYSFKVRLGFLCYRRRMFL